MIARRSTAAAPLLALWLLGGSGIACATRSLSAAPARHPALAETGEPSCADCHARATPAAVQRWRDGPHGLNLVQCFVCHGTTAADFRARPDPASCAGCHAAQVESVRDASGAVADCFRCHASHALRPSADRSPHAGPGGAP